MGSYFQKSESTYRSWLNLPLFQEAIVQLQHKKINMLFNWQDKPLTDSMTFKKSDWSAQAFICLKAIMSSKINK